MSIGEKLEKARIKAAGYGRLYGQKETAEDFVKLTYAKLYEDVPADYRKTVGERDAWVKRHPEYLEAIERKRDAYADFKTAETYLKLLFAEVDVYRTEEATARQLDRVHT